MKSSKAKVGTEKAKRVTRSISFEHQHFAYVTARAKAENRSFNWIINDLVRKDPTKG